MLPKIDVPIYETHLISNGELVRFRPFLVKEQKLFLMASESDDQKETINTIKQVYLMILMLTKWRHLISNMFFFNSEQGQLEKL
jgi:hypothetical protein